MKAMSITLKPEHEQLIQALVSNGKFTNSDEAIDTAFHLLLELNPEYTQWVSETREKVRVAQAEMARGEGMDGETVINQILEQFRQAKASQS
jgi:antitoxin ParD1/3/4